MLSAVDEAAAQVWLVRERTEHEAAVLFDRLADDMRASAAPSDLVALARRCAADERHHAELCRRIVDELGPGLAPLEPDRDVRLGPAGASPARRALFASIALGCITETLSTALLLEMRPQARTGAVRDAMDVILRDEVRHSRLGWAYLAFAAAFRDVRYIEPALPKMLWAAVDAEVVDAPVTEADRAALRARGVLPRAAVRRITESTVHTTIAPGFERYGLALNRAGAA